MHDEIKVEYFVVRRESRFGDYTTNEVVKRLKSADVEEVVRCKDCFLYGECQAAKFYGDNGYCSVGERRDNETNRR